MKEVRPCLELSRTGFETSPSRSVRCWRPAGGSLLSINPAYPAMGSEALFKSWIVVILAGLGSIGAAIPGGFLVGILETFGTYVFGSVWQDCVSISIIILIFLFGPAASLPVRSRESGSAE